MQWLWTRTGCEASLPPEKLYSAGDGCSNGTNDKNDAAAQEPGQKQRGAGRR